VNPAEVILTLTFVVVLLGLAGYFGWRQVRALSGRTAPDELGSDDRRYLRKQAVRRLFCSLLMVVFAGMLVGWLFLDARRVEYEEELKVTRQTNPDAKPSEEYHDFARLFTVYFMVTFLMLAVMLAAAAIDFWAIARYGLSQHRRLQADRRALLEEHATRRRQERNGSH
jgi:hypothetical protein